ncbi:MAG: DeoR/GlpR family DNA-binding transcription regulator [Collinsella sp.]
MVWRGSQYDPYERQERIVECLQKSGLARISELQEELPGVSISTLRRDLKELEALGKVEHLSGGAVKLVSAVHEVSISTRSGLHGSEKDQIAQVALRLVEDGDTLYLDSGSTCTALLRLLLDRDVTIYTTDASACLIKSEIRAQLIVVGGEFNHVNSSFCGSMTESILRDLYFDKAFIGINAIDEDRGAMTPSTLRRRKSALCARTRTRRTCCATARSSISSRVFARLGSMVWRLSRSPMTRRSPNVRA